MAQNMSSKAKRALKAIEKLEDAGKGEKFSQAKSYIKERGIVSNSFLQRLQQELVKHSEEM